MVQGVVSEATCKTNVYLRGGSHPDIEVGLIVPSVYSKKVGIVPDML